jgi:hypothetical protein
MHALHDSRTLKYSHSDDDHVMINTIYLFCVNCFTCTILDKLTLFITKMPAESVKVVVRVRPMNTKEKNQNCLSCVDVDDKANSISLKKVKLIREI